MRRRKYPLLEYDPSLPAIIEPEQVVKRLDVPEHCVICFFGDVLARFLSRGQLKAIVHDHWEDGDHPLYEMSNNGKRLAVFQPGVGAPMAAGLFEEVIARGCRKFVACGGCGVLDNSLLVGHLVIPVDAVRDEGTSYSYIPPDRVIHVDPHGVAAIESVLQAHQIEYKLARTWTTDAPYRETPEKIKLRRSEGCLTVEMETAALVAVAQFRGVLFGQILYAGDDVSGNAWNERDWQSKHSIREQLFWLAAEACFKL
jgi:uridine phosphorylase